MENILELQQVSKTFSKSNFALENVTFSLPYGSIMGFVGENGAGKTTTIGCILNTIAKDSGMVKLFGKEMTDKIAGMKFGVPKEYLAEGLDPEVKASFMGVLDTLKELGAEVEFFSIKTMEYMIPAYYIIASAEASSNLERFDGVKYLSLIHI